MEQKQKDDRWAKQFGDFAENLTMYVLGQLSNMSVALIDHVGADVIAAKRGEEGENEKPYAISVKGRNFPSSESKSFNFSQDNIDKLKRTSETFHMQPAVSFVFVDEMEGEKKIRIFVSKLADLEELSGNPDTGFINYTTDGITLRYTRGKSRDWLGEIRKCNKISYFELKFQRFEDVNVFS